MPATMPRKPKPKPEPVGEPSPESAGPKPISYRPSKEMADALHQFLEGFDEFKPAMSTIVAKALEEFLARRGIVVKKPDKD